MNECICKEFKDQYKKSIKFGCHIGPKKCLWCEMNNQPERSKREDIDKKGPGFKYDDPKVSDIYL